MATAQPAPTDVGSGTAGTEGASTTLGFQPAEQETIRGVIKLADQPVRSIMTPRSDLFWLDVDDAAEINR